MIKSILYIILTVAMFNPTQAEESVGVEALMFHMGITKIQFEIDEVPEEWGSIYIQVHYIDNGQASGPVLQLSLNRQMVNESQPLECIVLLSSNGGFLQGSMSVGSTRFRTDDSDIKFSQMAYQLPISSIKANGEMVLIGGHLQQMNDDNESQNILTNPINIIDAVSGVAISVRVL